VTSERDELIGRPMRTDIPIVVNEAAIIELYAR